MNISGALNYRLIGYPLCTQYTMFWLIDKHKNINHALLSDAAKRCIHGYPRFANRMFH